MRVGDLVRMRDTRAYPRGTWHGQMGIVTEFSDRMWWIRLTCGRVIATDRRIDMEVINGQES